MHWEHRVLATGPPWKFLTRILLGAKPCTYLWAAEEAAPSVSRGQSPPSPGPCNLHQVLISWAWEPHLDAVWMGEHISEVDPGSTAMVSPNCTPRTSHLHRPGESPQRPPGKSFIRGSSWSQASFHLSSQHMCVLPHLPPKLHPNNHYALWELKPIFLLSKASAAEAASLL